ncbi:hypothetical protein [Bosea sp. ANAM02]|uniref:hypothetical protein n=1 Tax=Bosea sp. ANAM02 TaxID=2020412 RepID=UPI0006481E25|nr:MULTISPECIES: hypothetical protein [Hyphomicrobiales]BCB21166.1 hypothetical protein OCUBac02_40600 [Bosea sp. ANAM02]
MSDIASDLFEWAANRPAEKVVDFISVRKTLPRWQNRQPLAGFDRAMARRAGTMALAPILLFPVIHPAAHLAYVDGPSRAQR